MTERQQQLVQNVEKHRQMILDAERWLWAHPQTGFTEWEAHNYLVEKYEALGYTLTLAGNIPGFYTEVDTGRPGPKLAIFGELDALDIANHPESVNGMTHCCGHNGQSRCSAGHRCRTEGAGRSGWPVRLHPSGCGTGRGDDPAGLP